MLSFLLLLLLEILSFYSLTVEFLLIAKNDLKAVIANILIEEIITDSCYMLKKIIIKLDAP